MAFTISSLKYDATVINQIESYNLAPNLEQAIIAGSGQIDPGYAAVLYSRPQFSFTTSAIKTALNLVGISGLAFDTSKLVFWLTLLSASTVRSGNIHTKCAIVSGWIEPVTLRCTPGGCTITYRVWLLSADGTTTPLTVTASQPLDAGQAGAAQLYKLTAVTINGATIATPTEVTITFGLAAETEGLAVYPTALAVLGRAPRVTISSTDIATPIGWGLTGAAQTATDSVITLADVSEGGVVGSTPITITLDEGHVHYSDISGSHGRKLGSSLVYVPTFDGTAAIMALSGLT